MTFPKVLTIIFLGLLIISCGATPEEKAKDINIITNAKNGTIALGSTLNFSFENKKNHNLDSVVFKFDGKPVSESVSLDFITLGKHTLVATVYFGDKPVTINKTITILNNAKPEVYDFKIINEYPHDITSYTQGLEFYNGELYESTGQYKESKLRKIDYKTGEVLKNINLADQYFGEGLSVLNNKIYQLTWRRSTGFVYDLDTFEKISSFKYGASKEGWGLCNDTHILYKSDGTDKIWFLNPETLEENGFIEVYTNKGDIGSLNELEFINGKIYANIYQRNGVAIINPKTGGVEAVVDFTKLKDMVTQHPKLDVLNGIAYNPETNTIFVTGKNWDKLFEVEIIK